jgi:hypothetical protein
VGGVGGVAGGAGSVGGGGAVAGEGTLAGGRGGGGGGGGGAGDAHTHTHQHAHARTHTHTAAPSPAARRAHAVWLVSTLRKTKKNGGMRQREGGEEIESEGEGGRRESLDSTRNTASGGGGVWGGASVTQGGTGRANDRMGEQNVKKKGGRQEGDAGAGVEVQQREEEQDEEEQEGDEMLATDQMLATDERLATAEAVLAAVLASRRRAEDCGKLERARERQVGCACVCVCVREREVGCRERQVRQVG